MLRRGVGPGPDHSPAGPGPTIWDQVRLCLDLDPDIWGPVQSRKVQDRTLDSLSLFLPPINHNMHRLFIKHSKVKIHVLLLS